MEFRLHLFCNCFYVCGVTNTVKYLVTNQTVFCTAGFTKKLSLKHSFYEAIFTCFLTKFRKTMFVFVFYKYF